MAACKQLNGAISFLSRPSSPYLHLRRLSAAASGDLNPTSPDNAVSGSVLHFLRGRGVGDKALAGFSPRMLDSKVGEDLPAKFDLLLTRGFSVPEAAKALKYHGLLAKISLVSLRERLDALQTMASDDAHLPRIVNRAVRAVSSPQKIQRMADNVSKLRGWGVPDAKIKYLFTHQPRFFLVKPQCFDDAADRAVAEFGVRPDSKRFVDVVKSLCTIKESMMESKFRVFESFGWERSGVVSMFKTFPPCIWLAEANLVKTLAFLTNEVGFDPSYITSRPAMLAYSLEKRIRPRFELVNALKSKNLLPKGRPFYTTLCMAEREFMDKYVVKFMKEEPVVCNGYINTLASLKQKASA